MAKQDVNAVVLTGNLVDEPKLSYQGDAKMAIVKFKIGNNVGTGKYQTTSFITIKVIGKQAENCAKFLSKGRQVAINGQLQLLSGKDENGEWWNYTQVVANQVTFMNGFDDHKEGEKKEWKPDSGAATAGNSSKPSDNGADTIPPSPFGTSAPSSEEPDSSFDDDLPF